MDHRLAIEGHPRWTGPAVGAWVATLLMAAVASAQFPLLDPDDCSSVLSDPSCTPTAVCTAFGNAPAVYDPANVAVVPNCVGGQVLGPVADADGTPRYACLYEPAQASTSNPLPMVVFLHPSLFPADSVQATGLIVSLGSADLTGDPDRPGFILLAPQGRNTCHYYPTADQHGQGWDNWYRNLDPTDPEENVDVATIDHFLDAQVAGGKVDAERIYLTGWSNGAGMAYLYGLHRSNVAAVGVFSSPDPFRAFNDPCPQVPVSGAAAGIGEIRVTNPGVPTFHIHNDCDIAGLCPMGERLEASLQALPADADHLLINSALLPATACNALCGTDPDGDFNPCSSPLGYTLGVANHVRWPIPYNSALFDFFRGHVRDTGTPGTPPEPLTVTVARVRASENGTMNLRGEFSTTPPFDASAAVSARIDDGFTLDQSNSWAVTECKTGRSGKVRCTSLDRRFTLRVKPVAAAGVYRFKVTFKRLSIAYPVVPPMTLTLTHGSGPVTRMGSITSCAQTGNGLKCRRR